MREILFKAKRLDNGQWVFGDLLKTKYEKIVYICYEDSVWKCDGKTVCQYIGLTDKNNVKIFENDMITIPNSKMLGLPGVVKFNERAAKFELVRVGYGPIQMGYFEDKKTKFKIVGNIYDNVQGV